MDWISSHPWDDAVTDCQKRVRKMRTECGLGLVVKEDKKGEN